MSIERKRKLIVLLAILIPLIAVTFPIIKDKYIKPKFFVQKCKKDAKTSSEFNIYTDEQINEYCNCTYKKLKEKYKVVEKFPKSVNLTRQDKEDVLDCYIDVFVEDSLKDEYINNKKTILDQI